MRFLVRFGYGAAAIGFAYLAYAAIVGGHPFAKMQPGDAGEYVRLAIVMAVNAAVLLLFAFKPGVWARVIAPVLAAAWVFVAYIMWSVAKSLAELAASVIATPLGQAPAEVDTPLPSLLVVVLALAAVTLAAALLDWIRAMFGAMTRPRPPVAA